MDTKDYVNAAANFRDRVAKFLVSPFDVHYLVLTPEGYLQPRRKKLPAPFPTSEKKGVEPLTPTVATPQSREHVVNKISELLPDCVCKFSVVNELVRPVGDEDSLDGGAGYTLTMIDKNGKEIAPLKLKNAWWTAMKAVGLDPRLTNGISYNSIQHVGHELWINNSVLDVLNRKRWEQKSTETRAEKLACMKLGMQGNGSNDALIVFTRALHHSLGDEVARSI